MQNDRYTNYLSLPDKIPDIPVFDIEDSQTNFAVIYPVFEDRARHQGYSEYNNSRKYLGLLKIALWSLYSLYRYSDASKHRVPIRVYLDRNLYNVSEDIQKIADAHKHNILYFDSLSEPHAPLTKCLYPFIDERILSKVLIVFDADMTLIENVPFFDSVSMCSEIETSVSGFSGSIIPDKEFLRNVETIDKNGNFRFASLSPGTTLKDIFSVLQTLDFPELYGIKSENDVVSFLSKTIAKGFMTTTVMAIPKDIRDVHIFKESLKKLVHLIGNDEMLLSLLCHLCKYKQHNFFEKLPGVPVEAFRHHNDLWAVPNAFIEEIYENR